MVIFHSYVKLPGRVDFSREHGYYFNRAHRASNYWHRELLGESIPASQQRSDLKWVILSEHVGILFGDAVEAQNEY